MPIITPLLSEFDHEMSVTRKVLSAVDWTKKDFKPHEKSMTLEVLATHLQDVTTWCRITVTEDEFNVQGAYTPKSFDSTEDLLVAFDQGVKECRSLLEGLSDEKCMATWTLKKEGQIMFSMPRVATLRSFVMNHMIHHRGQASVYLRLLDIPVPSIYGPSADNAM